MMRDNDWRFAVIAYTVGLTILIASMIYLLVTL